jgi:predicted permease
VSLLLHILTNNILPIFLAIGAGYALTRFTALEPAALSKTALYIFAPCLVFALLTNIEIQADEAVRIVIASVVNVIVSGGLAWVLGRVIGLERVMTTALMMVAMFTNSGNYGLALNQLAFGEEALARAAIYYVANSALIFTLGIYLASSGRLTAIRALKALFSMPPVYAVALAVLFVTTGIKVPEPVAKAITILGDASIPVMLVLLGVQIAHAERITKIGLIGLASSLRLLVAPVVALGMVALLRLSGPARQATVTEASMPTAVIVTAVATEFDIEPTFVTSAVVLTTLLSPITLTLLIALLR